MTRSRITIDPCTLFLALKRSAAREVAIARRKRHPGLLHGLFTRSATPAHSEHTVRLPNGEIIISTPPL